MLCCTTLVPNMTVRIRIYLTYSVSGVLQDFQLTSLTPSCLTLFLSILGMSVDEQLEEPDLRKYAAIDMAALRDVRQTGAEFVKNIEALLHSTPGLSPGYLTQVECTEMLIGVSIID